MKAISVATKVVISKQSIRPMRSLCILYIVYPFLLTYSARDAVRKIKIKIERINFVRVLFVRRTIG